MDNASFYFISPSLQGKLTEAGVIIEMQPPYCPDLNPIEYLFGSVKNRIRKMARQDEDLIQGDFKSYLHMQVRIVGQHSKIVKGHFKKAQIYID